MTPRARGRAGNPRRPCWRMLPSPTFASLLPRAPGATCSTACLQVFGRRSHGGAGRPASYPGRTTARACSGDEVRTKPWLAAIGRRWRFQHAMMGPCALLPDCMFPRARLGGCSASFGAMAFRWRAQDRARESCSGKASRAPKLPCAVLCVSGLGACPDYDRGRAKSGEKLSAPQVCRVGSDTTARLAVFL